MAISMATSLLSLSLSLLLLSHLSLAQFGEQGRSPWGSQRRFVSRSQCGSRGESKAGLTEYFDEDNEMFQRAGVVAHRMVIQPRGLLLPSFYNAPALVYIVQGRGVFGTVMPGCPESYQSFQRGEPRTQAQETNTKESNHFREGDVIAMPAGVAHWAYTDGDRLIVAITVIDTSNNANQLEPNRREFFLAGRKQRGESFGVEPTHKEEDSGNNLLSGFDTETLSEVMGIGRELAEKIRGRNDNKGEIVRVEGGFHIVRPSRMEEEEEEYEYEEESADIYNPNAGRTTTLNSQKLTILKELQLNAVRGVLHRNAHSVMDSRSLFSFST